MSQERGSDSEHDEDYQTTVDVVEPVSKRMCTRSMNIPTNQLQELTNNTKEPDDEPSTSEEAEGDEAEQEEAPTEPKTTTAEPTVATPPPSPEKDEPTSEAPSTPETSTTSVTTPSE